MGLVAVWVEAFFTLSPTRRASRVTFETRKKPGSEPTLTGQIESTKVNRIAAPPPRLSATQLGLYAEANLSSFIRLAVGELRRRDDGELLAVGVGLCRARQDVRASIRVAELAARRT